jgi:phosphoglucomutase
MTQIRFGTSGWRAVLADEFTFGNARRVVTAIARVLARDGRAGATVLVGYDTRFLADSFASEASRILTSEGFAAEMSNRPVPTPVLAFEIRRRGAAGALNFTASHNPPQYLGIKFSTSDGAPALPRSPRGSSRRSPGSPRWLRLRRRRSRNSIRSLRISPTSRRRSVPRTSDAGRPTSASTSASERPPDSSTDSSRRRGAALERLNARPDPLFGGESPQCGPKELVRLGEEVRRHESRLGLSCDGDADRFGVCDEKGEYVTPNRLLSLLLFDMLGRKRKRGGVARSVSTTHALDAIAAKFGVPLYETPVGFKYIGEKLIAGEIVFGAEESAGLTVEGHVPEKDGILADLLAAEMVGARGKTIAELTAELEREIGPFRTSRLDLPLTPGDQAALKARRASPPQKYAGRRVASVNLVDGLKLILDDGSWILARESGTEPVARVYAEARSEKDLEALSRAGRELLEE